MGLPFRRVKPAPAFVCAAQLLLLFAAHASLATIAAQTALTTQQQAGRVRSFIAARKAQQGPAAQALVHARRQHIIMEGQQGISSLATAWQPLGPSSIVSTTYGNITDRVTAIAVDPNDTGGNTLYLGTTGGGVWKSANAAGPLASVRFAPLTDTLPVFSPNAGSSTTPSLSIGSVAVQSAANPVVLAGTGDPNDATGSLYGEGILRSADGGLTWTLAAESHDGVNGNHSFAGLAAAGLAWSTSTPSLVVAAFADSGEAQTLGAGNVYSVPGLYYSTDAGQTWQMSTVYDGATVLTKPTSTQQAGVSATAVVWNAQRGRFFAAVRAHGYYSSSDGMTWTRLTAQPGTGLTTTNCPPAANTTCPVYRGALSVQAATGDMYAFTVDDNNQSQGVWQDLCHVTQSGSCANSTPSFATRLDTGTLDTTAGNYNLALDAAPAASNGTLLFAGSTDLYRCALAQGATSCSFRDATNANLGCPTPAGVAPAQHALASFAQSSGTPLLFLGNDSGLWRSLDGVAETGTACNAGDASHFDNLNAAIAAGGSLAEVVGFAQHPANTDVLLAGLGGNGTAATSAAGSLGAWPQLATGEGGFPQIDASATNNWYAAIGSGINLKQCTLGTACTAADFTAPATIGPTQVSGDASLPDAPTLLDPADTANLLAGTCRVWRGPAGAGTLWSSANAISPAFTGSTAGCSASSPLIRSIAAGGPYVASAAAQHNGSQVIYAGMAGALDGGGTLPGHLFVTTSADQSDGSSLAKFWTDISLSPVTNDTSNGGVFNPESYDVSSLFVDLHDSTGATVYAAIMGFNTPHVYRSADFGKHWLNISANLPDAPANSVIVDPNDANTVYVALDTGVYATQAVTTCSTANCWSVLGTALPNAPVTQLQAAALLPTGDGREGMLRAATYGRGIWQLPLLSAISVATPGLAVAPSSLGFGNQQVATQSASQTVTLTSNGNSAATISSIAFTGDFALAPGSTDTCTGQTLSVGSTCTLQISFAPTATGTRSGQLTVFANIAGGQVTVSLMGTGTAPASIVLTPVSLSFPATVVNGTAAAQIITVANTGSSPATLQTPSITGDFNIAANTCGTTLAVQTACSVSIAFTPTQSGVRNGTFSISDSVGTQIAQLSGTGNAPATDTLSPPALNFTQQAVGSSSTPQQITLTNAGDVPLTLISAAVSGSDFTVVNNCGTSLAAHSTCAFSVSFVPTAVGQLSGSVIVSDQFRSQTVALTGLGIAPAGVSLSPSSLGFGAVGVSLSAPPQTLTLTNNGGQPLNITRQTISQDFSIAATTCNATLAVNSACTMTVVFTPSAPGARAGTLVLTDNAPSGSQTVNLTGTGVDFTLAASGPASLTVASGQTATFPLLLNSTAGLSGNVALACTGAPAHSVCTVNPSTAALGSTVVATATVQTGLTTATLHPLRLFANGGLITLACALPFLRLRRKRIRTKAAACIAVLLLATLSGCGTGRLIPGSGSSTTQVTPTPSGTYTLTVTATAAGLSHNVPLTLVVQ